MDWSEAKARIQHGVDGSTEFKRTFELRQVGRAICGCANAHGGVVVLGVDDGGGIVGIADYPKSVEERLTDLLQNGSSAPVRASISRHPWDEKHVRNSRPKPGASGSNAWLTPNHMTVAAVRSGGRTRSRNEQMANYMLDRQYMERRGRGWLVMRKAMQEFNGTEPEIEHDEKGRFVTVSFKLTPA